MAIYGHIYGHISGHGHVVDAVLILDRHIGMKRINLAMKLDHELRLTRGRRWDMQNFKEDVFMMASRPSEAN